MDIEIRYLDLCKGIRCLDYDSVNTTIEFLESASAQEQRKLVRTLIRKGYTNQEIYSEINRVFGSHAIIKIYVQDVKDYSPLYIGGLALPALFFIKALFRK